MATIGTVGINVVARTHKLRSGLRGGRREVSVFQRAMTALKPAAIATGAAVTAAMWKMSAGVRSALASIDADAKFADRIGASVEGMQGLAHAASLAGVNSATLSMSLQRMTRRLAEAAQGGGEAVGALRELGLSAEDLLGGPSETAFIRLADRLSKVESAADRVRLAFKFFDSEGVALVPLISQGAGGIRASMAEAQRLGLTTNRGDARAVEEANDAMTRLGAVTQGIYRQLAVEVSPALRDIADRAREAAEGQGGMRGAGVAVTSTLYALAAVGEGLYRVLATVTTAIAGIILTVPSWLTGRGGAVTQARDIAFDLSRKNAERLIQLMTGYGPGYDFARRPIEGAQTSAQEKALRDSALDLRARSAQNRLDGFDESADRLWMRSEEMEAAAAALAEEAKAVVTGGEKALVATAREISGWLVPGAQRRVDQVEDTRLRRAIEFQTMALLSAFQGPYSPGSTATFSP